jgi:hypothetical protein
MYAFIMSPEKFKDGGALLRGGGDPGPLLLFIEKLHYRIDG